MTVSEAEKTAEIVQSRISSSARIIWGASIDQTLQHKMRVMLIITGVESKQILGRGMAPKVSGGLDVVT